MVTSILDESYGKISTVEFVLYTISLFFVLFNSVRWAVYSANSGEVIVPTDENNCYTNDLGLGPVGPANGHGSDTVNSLYVRFTSTNVSLIFVIIVIICADSKFCCSYLHYFC
jgi:hypothetical protein